MANYAEKLRNPKWQRKKSEIMMRDDFTCTKCGDTETTLNVHHEKYIGEPWETPDKYLKTLCENCHATLHGKQVEKELSMGDALVSSLLKMKVKICEPLKNENLPFEKQQEILMSAMLLDRKMMKARRIYG